MKIERGKKRFAKALDATEENMRVFLTEEDAFDLEEWMEKGHLTS